MNFITDMRATFSFSGYPTTIAFVSGWTASGDVAGAGYQHPIFDGNFGVSAAPDEAAYYRGAWFWRPATDDITAPVVRAERERHARHPGLVPVRRLGLVGGVGPGLAGRVRLPAGDRHRRHRRHDVHLHGDLRRRHDDRLDDGQARHASRR